MEFRDLKSQYKKYKKEIDNAIQDIVFNCNFISGNQVTELEDDLADYVGVRHCITCANGTDALTLMMMAWNIKEGDAVFVPDFTFFASGEIVSLAGATPIFVDVDRDTFNIDPKKLELAIQKVINEGKYKPKLIVTVDLFGLPANYDEIERIAKTYGILVLEDAAQGFGGRIRNKKACSFGDAATTSFFPAKPLGCYGDGGAIFTNDDEMAEIIRSISVHGKGKDKYDNIRIGINSRLDTIQAAILKVKLNAFINHELDDVNNIFRLYNKKLREMVEVPTVPEGYLSSFAQYTIKLNCKQQRDDLRTYLKQNDIPSMIYYIKPMHKQEAFAYLNFNDCDYPVTNELCNCVLSLPMHPYLTKEEINLVSEKIKKFMLVKNY